MPAAAITDQSNFAIVKFYQAALNAGIKPRLVQISGRKIKANLKTICLTLLCHDN